MRPTIAVAAAVLWACGSPADPPPESDRLGQNVASGTWQLVDGQVLTLTHAGLQLSQTPSAPPSTLATEIAGAPAVATTGRHLVFAARAEHGGTELVAVQWTGGSWTDHSLAPDHHAPDRVAISDDAEWVAFVSGHTAVASVWVVPFAGGAPTQLTNVGLERTPGEPPPGFVPPPHRSALAFDGATLTWEAPDGRHSAPLPR